MNLLRFRPIRRTVRIEGPAGVRKVKVTIHENQIVQQVEDADHLHATAAPHTIGAKVRFRTDLNTGLWVPLT